MPQGPWPAHGEFTCRLNGFEVQGISPRPLDDKGRSLIDLAPCERVRRVTDRPVLIDAFDAPLAASVIGLPLELSRYICGLPNTLSLTMQTSFTAACVTTAGAATAYPVG